MNGAAAQRFSLREMVPPPARVPAARQAINANAIA